jgi:hypothetical protein
MKVGDFVKDNHHRGVSIHNKRIGVIVENVGHNNGLGCINKAFKVLWRNGTIGNKVWDYDLKVVNESR